MVAQEIAAARVPVMASAIADLPASFEQLAATESNVGRMTRAGIIVGVLFDGSGVATVCSVTVETGDPARTDAGAEQVAAAGRALLERGWQVEPPELESGHHRVAAFRDGFDIAIHAWDGHWKVTLIGETPEL